MQRLAQTTQDILNIKLTEGQLAQFQTYADELMDWNQRISLTAITNPEDIDIWHFVDSLTCLKVMSLRAGQRVVDVGSGGGFPGLPLKIVCPGIQLTLIESTGKKAEYLRHMVAVLKLEDVTILNDRAEAVGQQDAHREGYDWVLARAVAAMPTLVEYLLPLCRIGGHCLPQKGESAPQEAAEAEDAIHRLGGRLVQLTPIELPTIADTRYLVDIEKVASTPPKYPRRPGMPNKRPL